MEEPTRQIQDRKVAKKVPIIDIIKGTYIKRPGWEPSGVLTKYGEITRVNIIGLIVSKTQTENSLSFLIDDGTGSINTRLFEKPNIDFELGDFVRIVGRVRENAGTHFIVPELLKKTNKKWHELHNIELKLQKKITPKLPVEQTEKDEFETGPYQKILNVISVLDKGSGVDMQDIISHIKIENCEEIIHSLVEEGEIFEISPGRVKLLE